MSAVGLEEMSKSEVLQYCLDVHEVQLRKKSQLEVLITRVKELDDTLENPLEVGEDVRYKNETATCTVSKVGKILEIIDANQNVFEVIRTDLTRVTPKPVQSSSDDKLTTIKTNSDPDIQSKSEPKSKSESEAIIDPETVDKSSPKKEAHYPKQISESSYRPKPGGIVIGGLPDDGSANTRKTGVTHVLDDKVETVKAD